MRGEAVHEERDAREARLRKDLERLLALRDGLARLHVDVQRWLTESDDRPNLRAAENRIRLLLAPMVPPCSACGHTFAGGTHDSYGKGCDVVVNGKRCSCRETP